MKKILTLLFILFTYISHAQTFPIDSATNNINFSEVITADSLSASALYSNAKFFIANEFISAKDVTQLQDDATNTVLIKGSFTAYFEDAHKQWDAGFIRFKLTIAAKDDRYKYVLSDLYFESTEITGTCNLANDKCPGVPMKKRWQSIRENAHTECLKFIEDLKKAMVNNGSGDW